MPDLLSGTLETNLVQAPYIYKHVEPAPWSRDSLLAMLSHEERTDIGYDNLKLAIAVCDGEKLAQRMPHLRATLDYIKEVREGSNWINSPYTRQMQEGSCGRLEAMLPPEVFAMMVAACPAIDHDRELWHKFITARPEWSTIKRR